MDQELVDLADRLRECRRRGHKLTLTNLMMSARILRTAKARAKRDFRKWLCEEAHMAPSTAKMHLRVAQWIDQNGQLIGHFATLGLAKIYALTTLDFDTAKKVLKGEGEFTQPIEDLGDVQFRIEFRKLFPSEKKGRNRQHAYQAIYSAAVRARNLMRKFAKFQSQFSVPQRRKLEEVFKDLFDYFDLLRKAG